MKKDEIIQQIVADVTKALEEKTSPWRPDWNTSKANPFVPYNPFTHRHYRGINYLKLMMLGHIKGYSSNCWFTFNQIRQNGGMVNKGEKGTKIFFYQIKEKENKDGDLETFPVFKAYTVFNQDQAEWLEEPEKTQGKIVFTPETESMQHIAESLGVKLRHGGGRCYYSPSEDQVTLPNPDDFESTASYFAAAIHEFTHSTSHTSRLNRDVWGAEKSRDKSYAFEELVAEIGSAYLCTLLDIKGNLQHTEYIKAWLSMFKEKPEKLLQACTKGQQAADYILEVSSIQKKLKTN